MATSKRLYMVYTYLPTIYHWEVGVGYLHGFNGSSTCTYNSAPLSRRRKMTLLQYVLIYISKNTKYDKGPLSLADRVLRAAINTPLCRSCESWAGGSGEDKELVENLTGALISESEIDSCTEYNVRRTRTTCWGKYGNLHALRHSRSRFIDYIIRHIDSSGITWTMGCYHVIPKKFQGTE